MWQEQINIEKLKKYQMILYYTEVSMYQWQSYFNIIKIYLESQIVMITHLNQR